MNPAIQGERHQKRRYVRITLKQGRGGFVATPKTAEAFIADSDHPDDYATADVWMSPAEVEALPEFMGF
jgi:hypothetical protein